MCVDRKRMHQAIRPVSRAAAKAACETTAEASAITGSMVDLCSAPCKALRVASTAHSHSG
jgi:hypothetical protein